MGLRVPTPTQTSCIASWGLQQKDKGRRKAKAMGSPPSGLGLKHQRLPVPRPALDSQGPVRMPCTPVGVPGLGKERCSGVACVGWDGAWGQYLNAPSKALEWWTWRHTMEDTLRALAKNQMSRSRRTPVQWPLRSS